MYLFGLFVGGWVKRRRGGDSGSSDCDHDYVCVVEWWEGATIH